MQKKEGIVNDGDALDASLVFMEVIFRVHRRIKKSHHFLRQNSVCEALNMKKDDGVSRPGIRDLDAVKEGDNVLLPEYGGYGRRDDVKIGDARENLIEAIEDLKLDYLVMGFGSKRELNILKERDPETEVALASLNAEHHKYMSKIAKAEAKVAGKAVAMKKSSITLAQVLNAVQESKYLNEKKVMKKKPIITLVTDLFMFARKSGKAANSSVMSPLHTSSHMSMFEREKLSGNNFNDWFRQLKLVLRVEKKMYVIKQPLPAAPPADSAANVLAEWNAIYNAYNEVACLILGSMTPELHREFENSSSYDMIKALKSMFEKQAGVERRLVNYMLCSLSMKKGLPKKAETPQVMMITGGKIQKAKKKSLKAKGKGKDKGNDKQVYIPKPKTPKPSAKEHPTKDDTCHHCKEFFRFREVRKLKQGALYLYVGNGVRAQVEAIGSFDLVLPNGLVIFLDNCHYAPSITRGVVLVHRLIENGFVQCFTDYGILVSKNNVFYFNVIPYNGIYEIDMHDLVPNDNSVYNVNTKRAKHNLDSTYLWHCHLAHISKECIEKLQHEGILKSTDDESFDQCVSCLSGKMTRKSFPHRPERTIDLLGIIHTNVCGSLRHLSRQGASYFITFTDDYSRYGYVYLLKHKNEGRLVSMVRKEEKTIALVIVYMFALHYFTSEKSNLPRVVTSARVLRQPTREVHPREIGSACVDKVIDDVVKVIKKKFLVSLSAPQIGVPIRIIVLVLPKLYILLSPNKDNEEQDVHPFDLLRRATKQHYFSKIV
uniref:peptide deformylase n=1 Tax=Tanacetum cinerariifolium TaxID=118510 RepID=A0A6L2NFF8_TANCI|nr:retrotransposon protein, putative, Ty1-copia subclass [Tanacetum cinerariifolium]